jgi:hypothetical protein
MSRRDDRVPEPVRHADLRRAYLMDHPLAMVVALWATVAGAILLLVPGIAGGSALYQEMPRAAADAWACLYLVGGGTIALGMWHLSARLEAAGCWLLAGTQFVNLYTIVLVRGGGGALVSGMVGAVAIGLIARAQDVVIDNLREEIGRYQRELESTRKRHRARMDRAEARVTELENELAEETKRCDERIAALAVRIADLEREPRRRGV